MEKSTFSTQRRLVVNGKEINLDRTEELPEPLQKLLADKNENGITDFVEKISAPNADPKELLKEMSSFIGSSKQEFSFSEVKSQHWDLKTEDIPQELKEKLSSLSPAFFEQETGKPMLFEPADGDNFLAQKSNVESPGASSTSRGVQSLLLLLGAALLVILFLLAMQFGYVPKLLGV